MKFNVEKLKALSRPMTPQERNAMEFRSENADWLRLSAAIALNIRKILRQRGMSQADLAKVLDVTPAQVSKFLSGKINFELKTIAKIQSALDAPIMTVELADNQPESTAVNVKSQMVVVTPFVKSNAIISNQRVGTQSYFSGFKIVG